jgi:hypothetical protein
VQDRSAAPCLRLRSRSWLACRLLTPAKSNITVTHVKHDRSLLLKLGPYC